MTIPSIVVGALLDRSRDRYASRVAPEDEVKTSQFKGVPVVLVVGHSSAFVDRCRDVAPGFGAVVQHCDDFAATPTMCARLRPLVIVISDAIYSFDPLEFDALARDVSARLLRFTDEDIPLEALELLVGSAVQEAEQLRAALR